ncbi:MAG TPA: metallophosphoesterase [Acidimicrobiia bacterium]|jgi:Icc-related predicted phosphoesterase|nr:metallophosphoesterase [Acidimicrobiia bacterium]
MQILLVSDLHYSLRQLDWVTAVAGDLDVVVMAGDFLDIGSIVDADAQIAVVLEYLARIAAKTTVVACSGNHDLNGENQLDERAARWLDAARDVGVFVDGSHLATDDVFITVCPWWDGPRTRELVDEQLRVDAARVGGRQWIWVYHAPADASPTSWTGKRHYGDEDLVTWIAEHAPAIVLSGHVHQSPFANGGGWIDRIGSTIVCNAGQQRGPIPTCIEIDTVAGTARWTSLAGVEEQTLARV